ncbi:MAG: Gfo/Idh/MocA family oxidoreductase [Phycisphaerae bacterium]|jgi:predicted dehydrogenase|nr:Gfo/Idh/MocA family oxidoreductase [Phycisphaerae bacterium]
MSKGKTNRQSTVTRRQFVGAAAAAAGLTVVPAHVLGGPGGSAPSDTLNIGAIGVGGHGAFLVDEIYNQARRMPKGLGGVRFAALCDVDRKRASATIIRKLPAVTNYGGFKKFPKAKQYADFRRMLDKEQKNIDAVVVAAPDHLHIPVSVMAMRMGKHCYCEKPLAHNICEARLAAETARKNKVATQMGIGNHSSETFRRVVEVVRSGAIGDVREAHAWCDNDKGMPADDGKLAWGDRPPRQKPATPEGLNWDLWLGPAPVRPYHPAYHPIVWRNWWDFGNGRLGDMGCHLLDLVFWALELKHPLTVESTGPRRVGLQVAPKWLISKWTFPRRGKLPPVALTWHHGGKRPKLMKQANLPNWPIGVLFVGSEGMLITEIEVIPPRFELYPKKKFAGFKMPPKTIPRSFGHAREWIIACKTGKPTTCGFDYAGPLTETVLLGNVAYRVGEKLQWDPMKLKAVNCPKADRFIRRKYRKGWEL